MIYTTDGKCPYITYGETEILKVTSPEWTIGAVVFDETKPLNTITVVLERDLDYYLGVKK